MLPELGQSLVTPVSCRATSQWHGTATSSALNRAMAMWPSPASSGHSPAPVATVAGIAGATCPAVATAHAADLQGHRGHVRHRCLSGEGRPGRSGSQPAAGGRAKLRAGSRRNIAGRNVGPAVRRGAPPPAAPERDQAPGSVAFPAATGALAAHGAAARQAATCDAAAREIETERRPARGTEAGAGLRMIGMQASGPGGGRREAGGPQRRWSATSPATGPERPSRCRLLVTGPDRRATPCRTVSWSGGLSACAG